MKNGEAAVSCILVVLLIGAFSTALANAETSLPTIRIKSDGSVDPASAPILSVGNTYVFTSDLSARGIVVEKPDVILDGAGFALRGPYDGEQTLWIIGEGPNQTVTNETWSIGVDLLTNDVVGLTVRNLRIENFSIGMYLWAQNCTSNGNHITNTIVGILVSGSNSLITGNFFGNNKNGVFFGSNGAENIPEGIAVYNNSFVNNTRQLGGCICVDYNLTETTHAWDNGSIGNFWSDYNGADENHDGFGDTPYNIDVLNEDRFPLMIGPGVSPTPVPTGSAALNPLLDPTTLAHGALAVTVAVAVILTIVVVLRRRKDAQAERTISGSDLT